MGRYSPATGSNWLCYPWESWTGLAGDYAYYLRGVKKTRQGITPVFSFSLLYESFRINIRVRSWFILFLAPACFHHGLYHSAKFCPLFFQDIVGVTIRLRRRQSGYFGRHYHAGISLPGRPGCRTKLGRKAGTGDSGMLAALGIAIIYFFHSYFMVLFAGSLIGMASSHSSSAEANWALATDLVPREEAARYLGLINLATAGGALSPGLSDR